MRVALAWVLLSLAACGSPATESFPIPERNVQAVLRAEGVVQVGQQRFDLTVTEQAAALGRALKAVALALPEEEPTLNLTAEEGTPFEHVKRLMAVLEAIGIDDYRVDRGR